MFVIFLYFSRGREEEWKREFERVDDFMNEFNENKNILVMADCNSRVADNQSLLEQIIEVGIITEKRAIERCCLEF